MVFQRCRKQQKSIKLGHSCCYHLPRSRSCTIRNRRQSTLEPLISRHKRNTETRDRGGAVRASCVAYPQVSFAQGRASAVSSFETSGQGTMCILLIVVDTERARPREDGTEIWPTFCGLCGFASNLMTKRGQGNANEAKPRKPQKHRKANGCALSASTSSTLLHGQHTTVGQRS